MYICICMYVYMYIYICIYICTSVCVIMYVYVCVCVYVCIHNVENILLRLREVIFLLLLVSMVVMRTFLMHTRCTTR